MRKSMYACVFLYTFDSTLINNIENNQHMNTLIYACVVCGSLIAIAIFHYNTRIHHKHDEVKIYTNNAQMGVVFAGTN